ncbi:hypothetical protein D3C85_1491790 [compost metagenome]
MLKHFDAERIGECAIFEWKLAAGIINNVSVVPHVELIGLVHIQSDIPHAYGQIALPWRITCPHVKHISFESRQLRLQKINDGFELQIEDTAQREDQPVAHR